MTDHSLPAAFADLERFVAEWALSTERQRQHHRVEADLDTTRQFYEAILPRMGAVFEYFDRIPHADVAKLPPEDRRLYQLACAFYEASHPIEMRWRRTDIDDAFPLDRLRFLPPSDSR